MTALTPRTTKHIGQTAPDQTVPWAGGHPPWCARDHRCTAAHITGGEHVSEPERWKTSHGTLIATRYHNARGGWVEIRTVTALDPHEPIAQAQCRHLIAVTHTVFDRVLRPGKDTNHA
ncbi:hypothetical protein [Catelliglobosispora koreensis]|uniref:hypothetical protein n=1 Tax=Catelliglobosispora koreensis TaxID=129052 RepID=UPI00036F058C|nr:hypothetical protein [Catelliglobosispora koreensis]